MFKFENDEKLAQAVQSLMEKYKDDLALLAKDSFLKEVGLLADKYGENRTSAEFYKEYHALRLQHAPNLASFDKEMQELQEQYKKAKPTAKAESPEEESLEPKDDQNNQDALGIIKEKYKDDLELLESKKFQKAVEKLAEKHDAESPEYQEDFAALRLKHAPNLANFDKEVQELQIPLAVPEVNAAEDQDNKKDE